MRSVVYVVEREVKEKLRDRGFLIFTVGLLVLVLAGPLVQSLFLSGGGDAEQDFPVALAGGGSGEIGQVLRQQGEAQGFNVTLEEAASAKEARQLVTDGEAEAAIIDGQTAFVGESTGSQQVSLLQSAASSLQTAEVLQQTGASQQQIQAVQDPAPLAVERTDGESGFGFRVAATFAAGILLFISLYLYGYWIANGIVEEKSSRVAEVVLSATKTWHILAGKVIGLGLLGLGQLLVLAALGLAASLIFGFELPDAAWGVVGAVLLWFVLGYAFYSGLFAISGAIVSRQEELNYTTLPMLFPLFIGYFVIISNLGDVGTPFVQTLSFIPFFSPIIMPARMFLGDVGTLEVLAAVGLTLAGTVVVIWLANRLYRGSILRFGSRVKLLEAWHSAQR